MNPQPQLRQLVESDIRSLSNYYREMSAEQGAGVLVVNYYPAGEIAQMSAKFLKASSILRLARQMGLTTLQVEFEQHNPQTQMVVAVITSETKGVVTVSLHSTPTQTAKSATPKIPTPEPENQVSPKPKAKRKSSPKTTASEKSPTKSKTQRQADKPTEAETTVPETLEPEIQVAVELITDLETTPKSAAQRKSSSKTLTKHKSAAKAATKRRKTTS